MPSPTTIRHWAQEHRPREKLLSQGCDALSDAELLALLLRTGRRGQSALAMAHELLNRFGGLGGLCQVPAELLLEQPGLGPGKVAEWLGCLEIGRRAARAELQARDLLTSTSAVQRYLVSRLRDHPRELFFAIYLDQANRLIADGVLARGTVNQTIVYPRELVKQALENHACGVIVAHNHPAGTLRPSHEDIELTRKLMSALGCVDIRLLDHVIVAGSSTVSLRETTALFRDVR